MVFTFTGHSNISYSSVPYSTDEPDGSNLKRTIAQSSSTSQRQPASTFSLSRSGNEGVMACTCETCYRYRLIVADEWMF